MSQSATTPEVETSGTVLLDASDREGWLKAYLQLITSSFVLGGQLIPWTGFVVEKENVVDNLLNSLLHCFEDIDKGEEIDFLQERLNIKSTNVDKICLLPLDRFQTNDVPVMGSKLATKNLDESQLFHALLTIMGSPLAAISVLRWCISQIDPLKDPFSMPSPNEKATPEDSLPEAETEQGIFEQVLGQRYLVVLLTDLPNYALDLLLQEIRTENQVHLGSRTVLLIETTELFSTPRQASNYLY